MITILGTACASPIKPIAHTHSGGTKAAISKYKRVLMGHDWEIKKSDASGGYIQAVKGEKGLFGVITAVFKVNIMCNEDGDTQCVVKAYRCENKVTLANCSPLTEQYAKQDDSMTNTLADFRGIK